MRQANTAEAYVQLNEYKNGMQIKKCLRKVHETFNKSLVYFKKDHATCDPNKRAKIN